MKTLVLYPDSDWISTISKSGSGSGVSEFRSDCVLCNILNENKYKHKNNHHRYEF